MSEDRAKIYRRNIEGAPLHRFLGFKIERINKREALVSMPVNKHTLNPAGSLHGGVVYLVSDVASFAAIGFVQCNNQAHPKVGLHECEGYRWQ